MHEKYFPVVPLRQVGGETMIELKNTNLTHKGKYFIYVVGTDGAGLCMMVWHQFIVDATPPEGKGELKTGPYWNMVRAKACTQNEHLSPNIVLIQF